MGKLPTPLIEPKIIHIPELGPEYQNYELPIGARDWTERNQYVLHNVLTFLGTPNVSRKVLRSPGERIGNLTIIKIAGSRNYIAYYWCKCDCGSIKIINDTTFTHCINCSCGCRNIHRSAIRNSELFNVWFDMNRACYYKLDKSYSLVGEMGIKVCKEWRAKEEESIHNRKLFWKAFSAFERWAYANGYQELDKFSRKRNILIRINRTKDFSPDNCEFVSYNDRNRNRSTTHWITAFEYTFPLIVWAEITGRSEVTILSRLKAGWPAEDAIATPKYKNPIDGYPAPSIPDEYLRYDRSNFK